MFNRLVNQEDFWLAWLVDVLCRHCEYRQALFIEVGDSQLKSLFIDHSHLFGGLDGKETPARFLPQYFDRRIYAHQDSGMQKRLYERCKRFQGDAVWRRLESLPDEWKTASALNSALDSLNRLSDFDLVWAVYEELMEYAAATLGGGTPRFSVPDPLDAARFRASVPS
jgi:hypothetical protein